MVAVANHDGLHALEFPCRWRVILASLEMSRLGAYSDEAGRLYRLKPAGDSDDPGHLVRRALVSTLSSGQLAGSSSSF